MWGSVNMIARRGLAILDLSPLKQRRVRLTVCHFSTDPIILGHTRCKVHLRVHGVLKSEIWKGFACWGVPDKAVSSFFVAAAASSATAQWFTAPIDIKHRWPQTPNAPARRPTFQR